MDASGTSRLEGFSDGVFSIAATLLVLEFAVTTAPHTPPLGTQLLDLWPSYLAYASEIEQVVARVNVVSPSACEAGLFLKVVEQAPDPDAIKNMVAERTPMQRLGTADDVCESILFLAGDESSYISGAVFPLDGGLAARRM